MDLFSKKRNDQIVLQLASHQTELLAFVQSLLPGDPSAEDILQRVNLVLWNKRSKFDPSTNFRAWAYSITRWEIRAYLKECGRKSWLVVDDELTQQIMESMVSSNDESPLSHMRGALEQCLKKLKPAERELLSHRYDSNQPLSKLAEARNSTISTMKVGLHRIRVSLRRCIQSQIALEDASQR